MGTTPKVEPAGPAEHSDAALMRLVGGGDGTALEQLYDRYGRVCYSLARRILVNEGLAQDVVQEVFLALWRSPDRFDPDRGGFSTWLLSMTHHKAVDAVRREETIRKRRAPADELEYEALDVEAVDDQAFSALRRTHVRQALRTLSDPQREVLVMAYFGGYTQSEIAATTGIPLGTVKTRMLAGMRRLRLELDGRNITDSGTGGQ